MTFTHSRRRSTSAAAAAAAADDDDVARTARGDDYALKDGRRFSADSLKLRLPPLPPAPRPAEVVCAGDRIDPVSVDIGGTRASVFARLRKKNE